VGDILYVHINNLYYVHYSSELMSIEQWPSKCN